MGQIEFKRNPITGIVEAYKDDKLIGQILAMGDEVKDNDRNGIRDKK